MVKKKRSAKQLANDRKLGRMAKARAKKKAKKKTRRKVAKRKKNIDRRGPPKKVSKKIHANYQIAAWSPTGKKVVYFDGISWTALRTNAALWHSKQKAIDVAKRCGRRCLVATTRNTPIQMKATLTGKV